MNTDAHGDVMLKNSTIEAWDILVAKLREWIHDSIAMIPSLVIAVLVMIGVWILANTIARFVERLLSRASNPSVTRLLVSFVRFAILISGLFTTLGILNLDKTVSSLLAGAGVIGLAIGFAFQEIAANFFSGILIAIRKPYLEGDIVQVEAFLGVVSEINLRTTNLRSFDGLKILIPNKDMFTKAVTNYTNTPDRRVDLKVGVSYDVDLRKVEQVARGAVEAIPNRLRDSEIEFFYLEFGESSITFQIRFWIEFRKQFDYLRAMHLAILNIKEAFDANGISIPFPIRTLDLDAKTVEALTRATETRRPSSVE